jgi:hypothetical protein
MIALTVSLAQASTISLWMVGETKVKFLGAFFKATAATSGQRATYRS